MVPTPHNAGRESASISAFAYLATAKTSLHRAIMRAFVESRERFVFQLRPQDVFSRLHMSSAETAEHAEIEAALQQLCEWGNLQKNSDTTEIDTAGDLIKHHLFGLTSQGEAAERALALFETTSDPQPEFHGTTALADIGYVLEELKQLSRETEPDAGKIHRNLLVLRTRFEELRLSAQTLIASLERKTGLAVPDIKRLIARGERFIGELVIAGDRIRDAVRDISPLEFQRLIQALTQRSVRESMDANPQRITAVSDQWQSHWEHFCNWFISQPDHPSNAEVLRERIRASIPALLSIITSIHDREIYRVDRSNDYRVLARWFAQAESDDEAHRLWRALFGLCPARHLIINDATLDDYEAREVPAGTSWLDAPPLRVTIRLPDSITNAQSILSPIIDRTAEKEKLAAASRDEALRILNAHSRFGTGRRMRLSELEHLDTDEFELFLDLLAEAVSARLFPTEPVEISSGDGCLRVKLEPTGDGREALIATTDGIFSGPDHWISIEQISAEEVVA